MNDPIDRQAAIDEIKALYEWHDTVTEDRTIDHLKRLPSAQPERLTDDDFETIRIHLNAYKEKLCNQKRWKEAEEYQRIIDRFISFASAQPDLDEWCHDCKEYDKERHCCPRWNRVIRQTLKDAQPDLPEWAKKVEEYRKSAPDTIYNPLAWALYQAWKEYDR